MITDEQHRLLQDESDSIAPASERRCAVSRESLDKSLLIRFVLSPEGVVVPDIDRRLPGRGVWVSGIKTVVETAVRTNAFARSLKTKADVPADLALTVESLLVKRVANIFALANKAGLAIAGFEKVFAALDKGAVAVVLHGTDAAADGCSKIDRKFKAIQGSRGVLAPIVQVLTIEQMSLAIGRGSVVHAALTPGGLSKRFLEEAERLSRYQSSVTDAAKDFSEAKSEG